MAATETPKLKIALIAEQRSTYVKLGYTDEECAALTHNGEVDAVATALKDLGHHVTLVPGLQSLAEHLAAGEHKDWNLAFNMAQGFHGNAREAHVPALLEAYQVPFTFSDAATMALCQNKATTKMILHHYGIPNAPFLVVSGRNASLPRQNPLLHEYPLFVKPASEGSSKGIDNFNKVANHIELGLAIQKLKARYPSQDILVEPFLVGREFTSSSNMRHHRDRRGAEREYPTWETKSSAECLLHYSDFHDMDDPSVKAVCQVALDAWTVLGCRDAGRVDIRFDSDDTDAVPNVLEWRDDQPSDCINLDGYPEIRGVKSETEGLNSRCGWVIKTFENPGCSGHSRFLDINDYCQDVPYFGDYKWPPKSFGVFRNGGC
ncbi:Halotolerance protein HAL2 [Purpureocillium lavendulum]|uniref:Halotolerance protein HAL2 n=1 Tax=Purpureocillium lavendulum TaxID=1247861 RepID=A0AB34FU62_9HYPO|nr:Halotolerance protein HAL2 [Purpureocillium lavendulum]